METEKIELIELSEDEQKMASINNSDVSNINPELIQEQNHKYFLEYLQVYEANVILKNQLASLGKEKQSLRNSIQKLEMSNLKHKPELKYISDDYTNRRVNKYFN